MRRYVVVVNTIYRLKSTYGGKGKFEAKRLNQIKAEDQARGITHEALYVGDKARVECD